MIFYIKCIYSLSLPFIFNIIEYYVHKLSHNPKFKILYNDHHLHHLEYPPSRLTIKKNTITMSDTRKVYIISYVISIILLSKVLSYDYFMILIQESTIYGMIINILHNCYHLEDSRIHKYAWFKRLQENHHNHHREPHKNFNLIIPLCDIINKTI